MRPISRQGRRVFMSDEVLMRIDRLAESKDIEADVGRMTPLPPAAFEPAADGDILVCGPTGHGLMGWRFRMRTRLAALDFDFALPCLQVLAGEETRRRQADDLTTVCKLVGAALRIAAAGRFEGRRIVATCSDDGDCAWRVVGSDGADECEGTDWSGLADVLVNALDGLSNGNLMRIDG